MPEFEEEKTTPPLPDKKYQKLTVEAMLTLLTLVNVANDNMDLGDARATKESQPAFEDGKREKKLISGRAGMPKI